MEKVREAKKHNDHSKHFMFHVEGVSKLVKYRGPVKEVLDNLNAGVRSGLSYSGARNIPELWQKARFTQVTHAGFVESKAHDVEF